jgi:multidrug efflux pump subunit AcrA (membrane-fusion protein)
LAISPSATSTSGIASKQEICWRSSPYRSSQNGATLNQLKSAQDQAEANRKLAQVTWGRDEPLVHKGWVTPQQGDTDVQTLKAREAALAVAQHNVAAQENLLKVLRQNREYALVVAPFDGVITQRNVDVGSLVQGNATGGTFMLEIMQKDVIRVWVRRTRPSAWHRASMPSCACRNSPIVSFPER